MVVDQRRKTIVPTIPDIPDKWAILGILCNVAQKTLYAATLPD